ncbi:ABC transporter ATP-binding protein [Caulobacter sp. 17J80-11]|uniref:ABC transporter ATP-binding protein n=1 Tax=Caulobacter sp. 17J80-11 TaxID=2763502 RepID=UPI001653A44C|nr:ABC transporter ATP-binding protein [Caulobacter sp. 17J80-11]MBC6981036.1 ABC transporter ATP-binding protein [Caulobacter sp. 17J80-11]
MTSSAATAKDSESARPLLGRIWRDYLKPRWPLLLFSLLCAAAVAGLTAKLATVLEPAVNQLMGEDRNARALVIIPLTVVGLALARTVAQVIQARIVNRMGHRIVGVVQIQLFGKLVHADLSRLRSAHSGAHVSSVLYDANLIREAFTNGVVNYTQQALTLIAVVGAMLYKDPLLAGLVLVVAPVAGWVIQTFQKQTKKAAVGAMAETSNLSTAIMESLDGVKIVKIENREAYEEQRVADVVERRQTHIIKGADSRALSAPVTEALMMVVTAAVLLYCGWRAESGAMNPGKFTFFITALAMASQALRQLANLQTVLAEGLTAAQRMFDALDVEPEISSAAGATALPPGPCSVRFEDVGFAYHEDAPILRGVTLEARPGETIALVGPSGGGKSTVLNLIPRFYDAVSGRVLINDLDVRQVELASLRDRIALVTQEPFLFDDTIRANIAYARPDAPFEAVVEAAKAAAAHEFIEALPKGYDTPVGEAGGRLSGGQRQRIAIARAFLKNAPILLLDEATSALDTESEARVQEALERLMQGRTTLLIAHRLSTVRNADRIYVIEAGRVVEQGSHAALARKGGLYARLAKSQSLDTPVESAAS